MFSLILALFLCISVSCGPVQQIAFNSPFVANGNDIIPGEYIIMLKEGISGQDFLDRIRYLKQFDNMEVQFVYEYGFAAKMSEEVHNNLAELSSIKYIEANRKVSLNRVQNNVPTWGISRIDEREYERRGSYVYPKDGGRRAVVYVVDTGVKLSHQEFSGRAVFGFSAIKTEPNDDLNGHGTHVASTIAGSLFGVAKRAKIVAVKVFFRDTFHNRSCQEVEVVLMLE
jgi:subtilisin family serine protease